MTIDNRKLTIKIIKISLLIVLILTITASLSSPAFAVNNDYNCAEGRHKYVATATIEPTPHKDGENHYECELCGYSYTKILYATAHVWSGWVIDTEPGCTTSGHRHRTCSVGAEHTEEETIPAAGHDYEVQIKEPTCLTDGVKIYTCKNCGDTYKEENGQAHGHLYKEEITTEPTEFTDGIKTYTCQYCGDSYTEPVPKLDHTHDYEILSKQEPGCETEGKTVYRCKVCGHEYAETTGALGHSYGEWIIVKNPNFTEEGLRRKVCAHDGNDVIEETLPKAITLEITPVTVAAATLNLGMVVFFIISIMSDVFVIRWDIKKRKELKERLREQRRALKLKIDN